MNHYSDSLLQGGQVQILQHPRTVLRTTAEENILSGRDQIKIFLTLFREFVKITSQGKGEKEMSEIIWDYLEKKNQPNQQSKPVRVAAAVQTKLIRNSSVFLYLHYKTKKCFKGR